MLSSGDVHSMRAVKQEILTLIITFVKQCKNAAIVAEHFLPPLLDPVLGEYAEAAPDAREPKVCLASCCLCIASVFLTPPLLAMPQVLQLLAVIVKRLKGHARSAVPDFLARVFQPTLDMITKDMRSFPDTRKYFYQMMNVRPT